MVNDIEEKPNPKLRFQFEAAQTLLKAPIQIQLSDQQHIYAQNSYSSQYMYNVQSSFGMVAVPWVITNFKLT